MITPNRVGPSDTKVGKELAGGTVGITPGKANRIGIKAIRRQTGLRRMMV